MFNWMKSLVMNQSQEVSEMRGMMQSGRYATGSAHEEEEMAGREKTNAELCEFVHAIPLFKNALAVDANEKKAFVELVVSHLIRRNFFKDSMVIKKGSEADEMYFIWSGTAEVFLDHPDASEESKIPPVAKLSKGTYFGEAALLSEKREVRNAWIRAKTGMEIYALSAEDLLDALAKHPVMGQLFHTEKTRMDTQRDAHFRRFATGGGNFRKGFKVKLKALGEREQLGQRVTEELDVAFDPVPVTFSRDAVEGLLLVSAVRVSQQVAKRARTAVYAVFVQAKMHELEDMRDQLSARGITEDDKELKEKEMGPLTKDQARRTWLQMMALTFIFFTLCFIPYFSVQVRRGAQLQSAHSTVCNLMRPRSTTPRTCCWQRPERIQLFCTSRITPSTVST